MKTFAFSTWILMIAISASLVAGGHFLVLQARPDGPTEYLTLRGDALKYFSMAEGRLQTVPEPFRYRVLAPFLARVTALPTPTAFMVISYLCLFLCYLFTLWVCARLEIGRWAAFAGLFAIFTSPWQLHNFYNPYLTDAPGMLGLFVMTAALVTGSPAAFLLAIAPGILARESVIFLAPAWLVTRQWKPALLALLLAGGAYLAPRLLLAPEASAAGVGYASQAFSEINRLSQPLDFVRYMLGTWSFLWFAALLGIALLPARVYGRVVVAFLLLLAGAIVSSLFASGLGRMFVILAPVMAIGCARLYGAVAQRSKLMAGFFLAMMAIQFFISIPTVITPLESWIFTSSLSRYGLFLVGTVWCIVAYALIRRDLKHAAVERRAGRVQEAADSTVTMQS